MHNEKHKETHREGGEGLKDINLGIKEVSKGKIYYKPPLNGYTEDYERVWHLKRNQFIKCLLVGWDLPKHIMDEFEL